MDATFITHLRGNLAEKRRDLTTWLHSTPIEKKRARLGPADDLVRTIRQSLQDFVNGTSLADDTTIVAGKVNGRNP